ncbi:hypothetical protein [Agromyces marinus]|uniref:Lipoprotein n=1 Tax=Agromyces marinus TaxID=1389020 RepID=A0ABN6YH58_9MICO|nr:hypothetical protein [Agromyces marinus]UIP59641.1 hypothetical protein DSM26151_25540 [Agromyces marinus]BDZ55291.1 hypothetical protein GCM10025870_23640 [Agromyces marinus]
MRSPTSRAASVALVSTAVAIAALLTGCAPGGPLNPPASEAPATTTPAPASPTSEAPAASDEPAPTGADRPLDALDAYALCRAQTTGFYAGDFALVEYAPYSDASVLLRDDGLWFVYIEVEDGNRSADLVDVAASNCIVGGTVAEPRWELFGVVTRGQEVIDGYDAPLPTP